MTMGGGGGSDRVEETPEERQLARIATERHQRYKELFRPVENEYIERVQGIDEGDADQAAGMVSAGLEHEGAARGDEVRQGLIETGAAPGSGRFNTAESGVDQAVASGKGLGIGRSRRRTENRRLAGIESAISIGQGEDAEAMSTISDVARETQQESIEDARIAANNRGANAQAFGSAAGLGLSMYRGGPSATEQPQRFGGVGRAVPKRQWETGYRGVGRATPRS